MEQLLQQLTAIEGVQGAALFNEQGGCVAHQLTPPFEAILLVEAIPELSSAVDMFSYLDKSDFQDFVANLENGTVIARKTGGWLVLIVGSPALQVPLVNVALSVVSIKLKQAGPPPAAPERVATGSMSLGSIAGSVGTGSQIPADAVGINKVRALLKALATQLGPFAKVLLKQEMAKMGVSARTVGYSHYRDLADVLGKRIPDESKRDEFSKQAKAILDE